MKSEKYEAVFISNSTVQISKWHLSLLYVLITWPIIYLLIFVVQPSWVVTTEGYIDSFTGGQGTPLVNGGGNLSNTLLTDEGRSNILWVSFLFALLVGFVAYLILSFY